MNKQSAKEDVGKALTNIFNAAHAGRAYAMRTASGNLVLLELDTGGNYARVLAMFTQDLPYAPLASVLAELTGAQVPPGIN